MKCAAVLLLVVLAGALAPSSAFAQSPALQDYGREITSDFKYIVNNAADDALDVATAPLHLDAIGSLVREPRFYYTLLAGATLLGVAFAVDKPLRNDMRHMSSGDADSLESGSNTFAYACSGFLYLYGLYSGRDSTRQAIITGFEAEGIASLLTLGFKAAFSRARPRQNKGPWHFFDHDDSFPSGAATPIFALAAAMSESADNRWYVLIPAYAVAIGVGLGRMGHDAHWASDIAGSALLGVGVTELLLWMHRRHEADPNRFRLIGFAGPNAGGVALAFNW